MGRERSGNRYQVLPQEMNSVVGGYVAVGRSVESQCNGDNFSAI